MLGGDQGPLCGISLRICVGSLRVLGRPPTSRRNIHGGWVTTVTLSVDVGACFIQCIILVMSSR